MAARSSGLELTLALVAITGRVSHVNDNGLPDFMRVKVNDPVTMSFKVLPLPIERIAEDQLVKDGIEAYSICNETFTLQAGNFGATMAQAEPAVPPLISGQTYFSLLSKRPVYDGVFLSSSPDVPVKLPLSFDGVDEYGPRKMWVNLNQVLKRGTLPSLHLQTASGHTYKGDEVVGQRSKFELVLDFATNTVVEVNLENIKINFPAEDDAVA